MKQLVKQGASVDHQDEVVRHYDDGDDHYDADAGVDKNEDVELVKQGARMKW